MPMACQAVTCGQSRPWKTNQMPLRRSSAEVRCGHCFHTARAQFHRRWLRFRKEACQIRGPCARWPQSPTRCSRQAPGEGKPPPWTGSPGPSPPREAAGPLPVAATGVRRSPAAGGRRRPLRRGARWPDHAWRLVMAAFTPGLHPRHWGCSMESPATAPEQAAAASGDARAGCLHPRLLF